MRVVIGKQLTMHTPIILKKFDRTKVFKVKANEQIENTAEL